MRSCISYAYRVRPYQVFGPSWIDDQYYSILAKIPSSGDPNQKPEMLQTLLAERFQLRVHRGQKEFPGFALVLGPNGPKFPASANEDNEPMRKAVGTGPSQPQIGTEGTPGGVWRLRGLNATVGYMATALSTQLFCPVVDQTGLKEPYNFILEGTGEDRQDQSGTGTAGTESGISIFTSIRELGLKLKPMKAPLDVIVVDRVERVPTAN
jgi:uncharacterized protein (TIGR03435 family)